MGSVGWLSQAGGWPKEKGSVVITKPGRFVNVRNHYEALVAVVFWLERTLNRYTNIISLGLRQLGEPNSQLVQM